MYQYDLHCHTKGVSKCAEVSPEEGAQLYIEAGYSGVVITNHFNHYTFEEMLGKNSWDDIVDFYLSGWRRFRDAAGTRLTVLLGMEIRFDENWNDYLVYGVTEEVLRAHPELPDMDIETFSDFSRENGLLLYQAHPFRDGMCVVNPQLLDGIETYNGHPYHKSRNDIAMAWAKKHGLMQVSGSDFHHTDGCAMGGILTREPIQSQEDLLKVLRNDPLLIRK